MYGVAVPFATSEDSETSENSLSREREHQRTSSNTGRDARPVRPSTRRHIYLIINRLQCAFRR
jgi:hypothetical protein